jgi:hypothetical protein
VLEVSDRTIRRRVAEGHLQARTSNSGHREVWLVDDDQGTPGRSTADRPHAEQRFNQADADRPDSPAVAALAVLTDRGLTMAEQRAGELREDLTRARRWCVAGWGVAAVIALASAGGGVWGVWQFRGVDIALKSENATQGIQRDLVAIERERSERLQAELVDITRRLVEVDDRPVAVAGNDREAVPPFLAAADR